jgi:hypothetical protein
LSKIQVDTIDTRSGTSTMQIGSTNTTTITLGVSGDTINVPSGVTIANSGTATGFGVTGTNLFKATMSADQSSVTDNTWTKATFDREDFDSDSVFDTSNNRFIAPADGKYFLIGKLSIYPNTANGNQYWTRFYKNGSQASKEIVTNGLGGSDNYIANNVLVNASVIDLSQNDYIELFGRFNADSGTITFDASESLFQGFRLV